MHKNISFQDWPCGMLIKSQPMMPASRVRAIQVLSIPVLIQVHANAPEKA